MICTFEYGPKEEEQVINFLNKNTFDNRIENISWVNHNKKIKPMRVNKLLPNLPNVVSLPTHVRYVREEKTDYFMIENHPALNGKRYWKTTTSASVSTQEKLDACKDKYAELERL